MPTALSADEIRVRAYLLWEGEGRQSGRDEHYWHEAILQLERERVSDPESASIGVAASSDASALKPAKRSAATKVGKATPANVGRGNGSATSGEENGEKNTEKGRKVTGERPKKAKSETKADTKVGDKATTKTEAKTKVKKKADAPAAASEQPKKSRRTKEDAGQAQTSEAP